MFEICQVCKLKPGFQNTAIEGSSSNLTTMRSYIDIKRNIVSENTASNGIPASILKEISLLKMLNHENVDGILSIKYQGETISFEYKCRTGIPLQDFFYNGQRLPVTTEVSILKVCLSRIYCNLITIFVLQSICKQIFSGLEHCHSNGVAHR